MGHSSYSWSDRTVRAKTSNFHTASVDAIFTQSKEKKKHKEMDPSGVVVRESCDSETHPNTIPIQFYLDVTGSMGSIPHEMIKDGLPSLMSQLIQNGVPDAALMFGAIGDHECDRHPLQVGQFESGDEELDMWLTRTYLEGNGGGNRGESYALAWYFAANHVKTDALDKRGKKGFVFTIGDEPFLKSYPMSAIKEIMGDSAVGQSTYSAEELYAEAAKKNHVYHIFLEHGHRRCDDAWKQLLGDRLLIIKDHKDVARTISDAILSHMSEEDMNHTVSQSDVSENDEVKQPQNSDETLETEGDML